MNGLSCGSVTTVGEILFGGFLNRIYLFRIESSRSDDATVRDYEM